MKNKLRANTLSAKLGRHIHTGKPRSQIFSCIHIVLNNSRRPEQLMVCSNKSRGYEFRQQMGLPIAQVTSTLALMELKGMVRQVGGMKYVVAREPGVGYIVE